MRAKLVPFKPSGLQPLEIDVTVSISDTQSATVARHPVEQGEALTDEVNFDPRSVQIELLFLDLAPQVASVSGRNRADRLLAHLRGFYRAKAVMNFEPPDEPPIRNLVISAIGVTRDRTTGRKRPVSLTLEHMRFRGLDLEDAVLDSDLEALGGLGSIDMGLQP